MFRSALICGLLGLSAAAQAQSYPTPTFNDVITKNDIRYYGGKATGPAGIQATITDPTGTFDNTPAINAACASGVPIFFPPGRYHIRGHINCGTQHSGKLIGAGPWQTIFDVGSDFNLSAANIFDLASQGGQVAGQVSDIGIECYQNPANTLSSQLIQYPWAISGSAQGTRPIINNLYIGRCWKGLGFIGNYAPILQGIIQLGVFNTPFNFDGARDYLFINSIEVWPFGFGSATNLINIWNANLPTSIFGRIDGLMVNNIALFNANLIFHSDSGTPTSCAAADEISQLHLNGLGTITVNESCTNVGLLVTEQSSTSPVPMLNISGAFTSTFFYVGQWRGITSNTTVPLVVNHGGELGINGGYMYFAGAQTAVQVDSATSGGRTTIRNLTIHPNAIISESTFTQTSASAALILSNIQNDVSGGTSTAPVAAYGTDNASNYISGTNFTALGPGTVSLPTFSGTVAGWYNIPNSPFQMTLTPTFATMGTFVPTSNVNVGTYRMLGDRVAIDVGNTFTTNAYTGASGVFSLVTNLPFVLPTGSIAQPFPLILGTVGNVTWGTNSNLVAGLIYQNPMLIQIAVNTSATSAVALGTANILPSTSNILFRFAGDYPIK